MTPMDKVFCLRCRDFMEYNVDLEPAYDGRMEMVARCKACRREVFVPIIHDQNVMNRMKEAGGNG